jgi:hypothetical protein
MYWCILNSGGVEWQIEHPHNSGKGSGKRLAVKFTKNIIMMHNHHYSIQSDASGNFLSIECGACYDTAKMQHEQQRHNTADTHITGAVLIRNGKPHLLNRWTDWELLLSKA